MLRSIRFQAGVFSRLSWLNGGSTLCRSGHKAFFSSKYFPEETPATRVDETSFGSPDFGDYKLPYDGREGDLTRKAFAYTILGAAGFGYAAMLKVGAIDLLTTMSMSKDVQALANISVDLASIPEGNTVVVKFRGKPLMVRHRTQKEIDSAIADDTADLRDPETDAVRTKNPKYLVVLGVCTHLGCVPIAGAGNYGGFLCPCHYSHYDTSGRIRAGPAPLNLEIPDYCFIDEDTLYVGSNTPPEE